MQKHRVLIVEDEQDIAGLIKHTLERGGGAEAEVVSSGAVQIGNAIEEKKVLDVILQARDAGLYTAITDCGAGGFSSAVGEMGAELGAHVQLDRAPLKYDGLSYVEIWISESQERMVLSVPPEKWEALRKLCASEGVEAAILGTFGKTVMSDPCPSKPAARCPPPSRPAPAP